MTIDAKSDHSSLRGTPRHCQTLLDIIAEETLDWRMNSLRNCRVLPHVAANAKSAIPSSCAMAAARANPIVQSDNGRNRGLLHAEHQKSYLALPHLVRTTKGVERRLSLSAQSRSPSLTFPLAPTQSHAAQSTSLQSIIACRGK
jgi:hypothetical protein